MGLENTLTTKLGEHFDWQGSGSKFHIKKNWTLGCGLLTRTNAHKKRITDFSTSPEGLRLTIQAPMCTKSELQFSDQTFRVGN